MENNIFQNIKSETHKGQNGVILLIGGSEMYDGAPIFCAQACLKSGGDLVYILTNKKAMHTIKALHEAIVLPLAFNKRILSKVTACIVGPGLGRISKNDVGIIKKIIKELDKRKIPLIVDGDGIHLYKNGVFSTYSKVIVTPNFKEAKNLELNLNHICIYKGKIDIIIYKDNKINVDVESSLKRCGGQGDILAGILATAVSLDPEDLLNACKLSCQFTRLAANLAFKEKGFSLITSDIISVLHVILNNWPLNDL